MDTIKQRIIQELVPGRQITLAHIIANPSPSLYQALSVTTAAHSAIGIINITPPETAIIIADLAIKSAGVQLNSLDIASGSLMIIGTVAEVETAVNAILDYVGTKLGFEVCGLTKT